MGFVGSAPGLVTLLAWSCARRQELPPSRARVRVGQWGSQRAQCSALAASVASRYAFGADGVGAARPGARGSRVTLCLALRARRRRRGRCAPGRLPVSPRNCARCLLVGGVGMSKKSCAARCSRGSVQGVLRAPAEGEGGVAHRDGGPCCHRLRHARAEHRYGGSWQEGGARAASPPLQGLGRAAGAPATRRRGAVGGACACRARSNGRRRPCVVVVVVRTPTPNYLRQASPDRGKYYLRQALPLIGGSAHGICTTTTRSGNQGHTHAPTLRRDGKKPHTRARTHSRVTKVTHTHSYTRRPAEPGGSAYGGGRRRVLTQWGRSRPASVA